MYTVEGSMASFHMRSSPGINVATTLGGEKLSPRFVEWVAVTPGASVRLVRGKFGTLVTGSGEFTAMSASPPPGASPRFSGLPTLLAHPPAVKEKMPQLSGWPSYLKGRVPWILPALFGGPSKAWSQRHRSTPPGTPRMETT